MPDYFDNFSDADFTPIGGAGIIDDPVAQFAFSNANPASQSSGYDWSDDYLRPVAAPYESAAAQRERLRFNLENDYAPDAGSASDQALLGMGLGFSRLAGAAGGLSRFVGADDTGRSLSRYARSRQAEYEDLADTLGTSVPGLMAREAGETLSSAAPMAAAGAVGGALGGPTGAKIGFSAVGGLQTLGATQEAAEEAYRAQGMSEEEATRKARIPAALAGATSAVLNYFIPGGAAALLNRFTSGILTKTATQQILKEALSNALTLGGLSGTDVAAQGVIAKASYDPERTLKDIASASIEAASGGAGLGVVLGAPGLAARGLRAGVGKVRGEWEKLMNEPDWQPGERLPGGGAEQTGPAKPTVGEPQVVGPRPLMESDAGRVKLTSKILKAAGYDPEFAGKFADTFARLFDPTESWDGEAYRGAVLKWLDVNGVRPVESMPRRGNFRAEQEAHNKQALQDLFEQARMSPGRAAPITEAAPESTARATETPVRETPTARTETRATQPETKASVREMAVRDSDLVPVPVSPREFARQRVAEPTPVSGPRMVGAPSLRRALPAPQEASPEQVSMSAKAEAVFNSAKATPDEFSGVDATSLSAAERRALAERGISFSQDRQNKIIAVYPQRLRVEDLRQKVQSARLKPAQSEMGFADDAFKLGQETTTDGERIVREREQLARDRAASEAGQTQMFEQPAAPAAKPTVSVAEERPPDILDWVEANGGMRRIKAGESHELAEPWKRAQNKARDSFKGRQSPDTMADLYRRETGKNISDEEFLNMIEAAPDERAAFRKAVTQRNREAEQDKAFQEVVRGNRRKDASVAKEIVSDELSEGDQFSVQGHRFVATNVKIDPNDGTLRSATLNDGPKFGTQKVGSDATLYIDKGSLRRAKPIQGSIAPGQRQAATGASQTGPMPPEATPPEGGNQVTPTATGVNAVRETVAGSKLSDEAKAATALALDALEKSGLDTSKLRLEMTQEAENGLAGSALGSVIRLAESADPSVGPEEVFHLMISSLPESDRAALESERVANLPKDAPETVKAGTMSTEEFQTSKLPIEWYRWINADEYAAHIFADKTARAAAEAKNPGLWQRIKEWFAKIWEALKALVKDPAASERIYRDMQEGRQKYDPAKRMGADVERRGKFVTTEAEATKAAEFAKGETAKKIEGEEFLAQVDGPVKLMEMHGVQNLSGRGRRALGYTDAKGIHEVGAANNGAAEDYYTIRNRSEPWLKQRLGVMANQHAVAFQARLNRAVEDGVAARAEVNSPEMREKMVKMQSAFLSALLEEQAFHSARVGIQTALNEALELLKKEKTSDLRQAQLEAEIRTLKEVGESRVALERLLDDMTRVLMSAPQGEWILKNGGKSQEIGAIYRDLKRSAGQTIGSSQLIGVASYLLSRMPELRRQMLAAEYAKQEGPLAAARARLKTLLDGLRNNPAATLERMMKAREQGARNLTAAEMIYEQLQKELTRDLEPLYDRMKTGEVAVAILNEPAFKRYMDDVQRDARAFGLEKPFEPFVREMDAPGGMAIEPDGRRLVGLGTDIMMANDALVRKRYKQATDAIKRYDDWLETANPDHPLYDRHLLERNALRDYWGDVALLTPNHRDDPIRWTLSMLDKTVSAAGGRLMPQVKRAANGVNRMTHFAKAWNVKATAKFEPLWRAAMKSHGLKWNNLTDNDLARASSKYNAHFQELANRAQFRHGGLAIGDKSMAGWTVTKADMDLLAEQTRLETEAFEIVQKQDRQITEDTRGLPEGTVVYRRAAPVTRYTLPRIPNFDRIPVLEPVANAYRKFQSNPQEGLEPLIEALESIWPTDGDAFLSQRNSDFSNPTVFDQAGGAFDAIAEEIRGGRHYDSFERAAERVSELSGKELKEARLEMAAEFGRITSSFVRKLAKASEAERSVVVKGGDPTNSFTQERGEQLGPWTFYRTGWSSTDDVRATAGHMVSVAQHRLLNGMKAQLADLLRMKKEFEQRQRELDREGAANPTSKAANENKLARRRGTTFDSWLDLDYRISAMENRIKEIEDHTIPRVTEASKVVGRYLGATTRVLISSFTTTFRNIGLVYPYRTMYALGNGSMVSALAALGIGSAQAGRMLSSFGFSMMKIPVWTLWKGIGQGVASTLKGQGATELWKGAVRALVIELSRTAQLRLKDVAEMVDAGVHIPADGEAEYNNAVADAIYREIPKEPLSRGAKLALAPLAAAESTFLAAVTAGNPSLGDAAVNSIWWKFLKSYFGPAAVFKRKTNALLKRLDRKYYRTFDLEKPTAAENALEPADLNLTSDQLSRWRRSFAESGMNFDAKIVDFMKRLKADAKADFLTKEETIRLANWGIEQFNRPSATNVPKVFQSNNPLIQWIRPLLGWQTRALGSMLDFLSVPAHVPKPATSDRMVTIQKMGQWLGKAATAVALGTLVVGTISEIELEGVTRAYRSVFYNQVSPNRWPWEHETNDKQIAAMARYPAQSVPLLAMPITAALPGNTSRATFNPSLVMLEKSKDVASWVSYGMQTGDWWYKTPSTASGFYQDIKMVTARAQAGLTLRRNAAALVSRFGPEDLARKPDFSVPNNLSELSPYGQKLWDAAYRGDRNEVLLVAREAMETARRIGKADPRKSVEDLFRNGNFVTTALQQMPSASQYRAMLAKMDGNQVAMLKEAETNYRRAAGWLGFSTPNFYRSDEQVTQRRLSRAANQPPIGVSRLSRVR